MDKKVYILVPVYNVQKVIKDCLNSIIAQTYTNWEMILVDDGSTDNSGKICDIYAEKDKRIKVIHQKNGGLPVARLTGVKALPDDENSYCTFVDSDDILPHNSIELMLGIAEKYDCDIVSGEYDKFLKIRKPNPAELNYELQNLVITENDKIINDLYFSFFGYDDFNISIVSKLFKTNFLKNNYLEIKEWPYYFGEDLNVTIRILPKANRVASIKNFVYYYRFGGGTDKFMKSYIDDTTFLYKLKKEYSEKYGISDYYKGLIDVEMKNLALQYFVMCIRSKTYPHGAIEDEIKFLLDIPEFYNAVKAIPEKTLASDHSEVIGFTQAFVRKDIDEIKRLSIQKAKENKIKRFIKRFL